MKFGDRLKNTRLRAEMTQEDVAKRIGVTRQSLSNWENNLTYPDLSSVVKMSDLYQVPLDDLLRNDMELKRRIEQQRERMLKLCSLLRDFAVLLMFADILLVRLERFGLGIAMGSLAFVLIAASSYVFTRFLGLDRKLLFLGNLGLALELVGQMLWWHNDALKGIGLVLEFCGLGLFIFMNHHMKLYVPIKRTTAFTGFVFAFSIVFACIPFVQESRAHGDHVEGNPFTPNRYRVVEVIQGQEDKIPMVYLVSNDNVHLDFHGEEDVRLDGEFLYIEQPEGATTFGVWEMFDSGLLYRITVEADRSVSLGCIKEDQVQWEYRLELAPTMDVMVKDILSTSFGYANWYYADTVDGNGELEGIGLDGRGTVRLTIPGDAPTVTIYEEYRDGDSVEYNTMTLSRDKKGNVEFEKETRQDGGEQVGIYRIPYENGEFILVIQFNK